jgi:hypothetical protein
LNLPPVARVFGQRLTRVCLLFTWAWDLRFVAVTSIESPDVTRQMVSIEGELAREFPEVDAGHIHGVVAQAYANLLPSKVTTYLPILVMRDVKPRLRAESAD